MGLERTRAGKREKSVSVRVPPGLDISVTLPLRMLHRQLGFLRRHGLGVEVMLYDTNWICNWPVDKVSEIARELRDAEIKVSAHGPIHDLNPGSLDAVIRDYTRHCYLKTLAICGALGAESLVLHLGINPLLPESALDKWLAGSLHTWTPIVELAEQLGIGIRLENMFLPSPKFIVALKNGLKSNVVKFCFDISHFTVYGKIPLSEWLNELGDDVAEIHLSDTMGKDDEHLALGKGATDFRRFFRELTTRDIHPQFTIEMTNEKFEESLKYLLENGLLAAFVKQ